MRPISETKSSEERRIREDRRGDSLVDSDSTLARAGAFARRLSQRRADGGRVSTASTKAVATDASELIQLAGWSSADSEFIAQVPGERALAARLVQAAGILREHSQESELREDAKVEPSLLSSETELETSAAARKLNEAQDRTVGEEDATQRLAIDSAEVVAAAVQAVVDLPLAGSPMELPSRAPLNASAFVGIVDYALLIKDAGQGAEFCLGLTLRRPGDSSLRIRSLGGGRIAVAPAGGEAFLQCEIDTLHLMMAERGLELLFESQTSN